MQGMHFHLSENSLRIHVSIPASQVLILCVFQFLLVVILLNMVIALMADLFEQIKALQDVVFIRNRAGVYL